MDNREPIVESVKALTLDILGDVKTYKPDEGHITIKVSADKKTAEIYNFYTEELKGVLLSVTNGKDDMPIYEFDSLPSKSLIVVSIPVDRYTSISKSLTLDDISYRLVRIPDEYEERKNDKTYSCYEKLEKEAEEKAENEKKMQEALEKMKSDEETKKKEVKKSLLHSKLSKILSIAVPLVFIIAVIFVMIFVD